MSLHRLLLVMAAASALHVTVAARPQSVAAPTGPRPVFSYCWQRVESARGNVGWILNRYAFGKGSFWMELMRYDGRWVIARMY